VATASESRGREVEAESEPALICTGKDFDGRESGPGDTGKCIDAVYIVFVGIPVGIFSSQGIGSMAKCTKEP